MVSSTYSASPPPAVSAPPRRHTALVIAAMGLVLPTTACSLSGIAAVVSAANSRHDGGVLLLIGIGCGVLAAGHRTLIVRLGAMGRGRYPISAGTLVATTIVGLGWLLALTAGIVATLLTSNGAVPTAFPLVAVGMVYATVLAALPLRSLDRRP